MFGETLSDLRAIASAVSPLPDVPITIPDLQGSVLSAYTRPQRIKMEYVLQPLTLGRVCHSRMLRAGIQAGIQTRPPIKNIRG